RDDLGGGLVPEASLTNEDVLPVVPTTAAAVRQREAFRLNLDLVATVELAVGSAVALREGERLGAGRERAVERDVGRAGSDDAADAAVELGRERAVVAKIEREKTRRSAVCQAVLPSHLLEGREGALVAVFVGHAPAV